ncbi:Enolase [Paratrimastix pyriformis]|uniref:phosphopyruvate hydratase n=1 Tax=Paratrimastix pyriformis TaxID=342808 RepID=A0SNX4_9EUKA|nr:enolase [Paratrimastix pyriformis]KAJ4462210.1 Enolase [Paratrimastix pyriformis]
MAFIIRSIHAREIIDSRGMPTTEVDLTTDKGLFRAAVPSGASTGIYEALELRDGGDRFLGKGVMQAVRNVNEHLAPALIGRSVENQAELDDFMCALDGDEKKKKFGANAILPISMAACRAAAAELNIPLYRYLARLCGNTTFRLPVPCLNVLNGGKHAGNKLPMQEYMIAPAGAPTFREGLRMGCEVYQHLKSIIKTRYGIDATNVGDEGGFAPPIVDVKEPLRILTEAIAKAGYTGKIFICMDSAASEFFDEKAQAYNLNFKNKEAGANMVPGAQLADIYEQMATEFPIASFEDPFDQDDFESYARLTSRMIPHHVQVVGDDLLVTNVGRVRMALERHACNSLLLKVNQIGTVTESIRAAKLALENGWSVMVSHRSGETSDTFISDLTVGLGCGQLKTGAPCRGERTAKYNQLLRIEEELGSEAVYGFPAWTQRANATH